MKDYDVAVFVGRFQPFHDGHKEILDYASTIATKVVVVIGSAGQPRSIKNPFTANERKEMIHFLGYNNVDCVAIRDQVYNDQKWVESIQEAVAFATRTLPWKDMGHKIAIIGHEKDESSFYLTMFPQWDFVPMPYNEAIDATQIRHLLFSQNSLKFLKSVVPENVFEFILEFSRSKEYNILINEYDYIKKYKESWAGAPFPPVFVTVDAIVFQAGHILLVQRKASPGAGLWALPGGFINQTEKLEDAMVRELREETKLKVPDPVLRGSIKASKVFDSPARSTRGRTITHGFMIELPPGELPKVKGADDAEKAFWLPISELDSEKMFEDHYSIIQYFLGRV